MMAAAATDSVEMQDALIVTSSPISASLTACW
jgi:hypothetical protein